MGSSSGASPETTSPKARLRAKTLPTDPVSYPRPLGGLFFLLVSLSQSRLTDKGDSSGEQVHLSLAMCSSPELTVCRAAPAPLCGSPSVAQGSRPLPRGHGQRGLKKHVGLARLHLRDSSDSQDAFSIIFSFLQKREILNPVLSLAPRINT